MPTLLDTILLLLILVFYGVGDVATTLYGMKKYGLKEENSGMTYFFGEQFRWYESLFAKSVTLLGVVIIYLIARVWYTSWMYQALWWCIATLIILRGIQVSYFNWREIRGAFLSQR